MINLSIFPAPCRSSEWSQSKNFLPKFHIHLLSSHPTYISSSSQPPTHHYYNNTRWSVNMKFLVIILNYQLTSPSTCIFQDILFSNACTLTDISEPYRNLTPWGWVLERLTVTQLVKTLPDFHQHVHKNPPLNSTPSHTNPAHNLAPNVRYILILSSHLCLVWRLTKWLLCASCFVNIQPTLCCMLFHCFSWVYPISSLRHTQTRTPYFLTWSSLNFNCM